MGFMMEGHFNIIGAIEQDLWAAETFKANHSDTEVIVKDIREVSDMELSEKFGDRVDVLLGGPPCQGYSIANINHGDPKDPRNSLFMEFLRVARVLSPDIVIMENVPNIVNAKTKNGEYVVEIIKDELTKLGYEVRSNILNATDYGVPQIRRRLVIIASKERLTQFYPIPEYSVVNDSAPSIFGTLKRCPTLWDAISDLPDIDAWGGQPVMEYTLPPQNHYQALMREGSDKVYNHTAMKHSKRMVERMAHIKWGESSADVPHDMMPHRRSGNGELSASAYDQNNRRMFPYKPCHTIAASFYANFVHPFKNRAFTPREGARIQSFPDWYVFKGRATTPSRKLLQREGRLDDLHLCQYNQIGNAVPPLMAQAIASNLYQQLKNNSNVRSRRQLEDQGGRICQRQTLEQASA